MSQPNAYVSPPVSWFICWSKGLRLSLSFLFFSFSFFLSFFFKKKNLVKNLIIWLVNSEIINAQFYFHPLQLTTRTVHPTQRTDQPEQPVRTRTNYSDINCRSPPQNPTPFESVGRFPPPKPEPLDLKPKNLRWYSKDFQRKLTKTGGIWSSPTKITWNPIKSNEIRWDLVEI